MAKLSSVTSLLLVIVASIQTRSQPFIWETLAKTCQSAWQRSSYILDQLSSSTYTTLIITKSTWTYSSHKLIKIIGLNLLIGMRLGLSLLLDGMWQHISLSGSVRFSSCTTFKTVWLQYPQLLGKSLSIGSLLVFSVDITSIDLNLKSVLAFKMKMEKSLKFS